MRITSLPVYCKLAVELELPVPVRRQLPSGWRLSQHQLETYNSLANGDCDVVINTALSGDDKSLFETRPPYRFAADLIISHK